MSTRTSTTSDQARLLCAICPYEQRNLPFKQCISCNFPRLKISTCKRTIIYWGIQRVLGFFLNICVFKDTYMTRDPCEKDMFTNINRRLIHFTLRKSFGLYNFHYHESTWIRRDNELQRKRCWNSFCAEARTGRWSSETIHLLSINRYRIYFNLAAYWIASSKCLYSSEGSVASWNKLKTRNILKVASENVLISSRWLVVSDGSLKGLSEKNAPVI